MTDDQSAMVGTAVDTPNLVKIQRFSDYMAGRAKLEDGESNADTAREIQAGIAIKVLEAKTIDEVWDADEGSLPGGRDLVDVEQRIHGIEYVKSKRGPDDEELNSLFGDTYLIVRANRLDTGEDCSWNTSASGLVSKLVRLEALGAFDNATVDAVIRAVGTGAKKPLKLRPIAKRAI